MFTYIDLQIKRKMMGKVNGIQEVVGSIPISSTQTSLKKRETAVPKRNRLYYFCRGNTGVTGAQKINASTCAHGREVNLQCGSVITDTIYTNESCIMPTLTKEQKG